MTTVSRNSPCPCGSGRRYKDCCGVLAASGPRNPVGQSSSAGSGEALLLRALEAQKARDLAGAEALYRDALKVEPNHADALHMLGVIRMERGDDAEAARLIMTALDETNWQIGSMQHNLGLALSRMLTAQSLAHSRRQQSSPRRTPSNPVSGHAGATVSVVLPVYNHERYVGDAIRSVLAQDVPPLELIVIDDGSTDQSASAARQAMEGAAIRCHFLARENRGAAATLNQAVQLARGDFIQPLNSDDLLGPGRLSAMLRCVAETGAELAFSAVDCIDAAGSRIDEFDDPRVFALRCSQSNIADSETVGLSFIAANPAVSTGNLFFSRALFDRVGGFQDLRYHHDWDFVLRALWHTEPEYIGKVLYRYRFHERNTISELGPAKREEVDTMMGSFLQEALSRAPTHALAPCVANWGSTIIETIFSNGLARLIPRTTMTDFYQRIVAAQPTHLGAGITVVTG